MCEINFPIISISHKWSEPALSNVDDHSKRWKDSYNTFQVSSGS
uniref:Uncharacterized protein n=1 Tax=Ascaris lumbricoides TaxID=6252 RepID=A0A0M3HX76_ASCLU